MSGVAVVQPREDDHGNVLDAPFGPVPANAHLANQSAAHTDGGAA